MSRARIIFDSCLEMEPGEKMLITCTSHKQAESIRSSLYRERNQWKKGTIGGGDIGITRRAQGDKHILIIERLEPVPPPIIYDRDGKMKKVITIKEEYPLSEMMENAEKVEDQRITVEFQQDQERMKQLMRQDGLSEEEIDTYFKGKEGKEVQDEA